MAKLTKKRSAKAGLPPGSLVHIGEKTTEKVKVSLIDYDAARYEERAVEDIGECFAFKDKPSVTWINIDGLHQIEALERLGEGYGFHQLVLEDILNTDHRPKMEDHGEYIYLVLKMLSFDEGREEITSEQVSLLVGPNYVISFREKETKLFDPVRERIKNGKGRIRRMGADYLAYALVDCVVDQYFVLLERLGEEIEVLEDRIISSPASGTLQTLHNLKKEMLLLRRSVWPLREAISSLERGDSSLIGDSIRLYLRDVYDHVIQVIDTIETFREMLSGMLDIYLSSVSNKTNEVMKVLTIITTIFMPLTFLAGVYGMNFKYMPELERQWAYPMILLVMLASAILMVIYFKRKKWI